MPHLSTSSLAIGAIIRATSNGGSEMYKKNLVIMVLAVVLTAIIAGGAVYLWQQNSKDEDSTESAQVESTEQANKTELVTEAEQQQTTQSQPTPQVNDKQLITEAMAAKYSKDVSDTDLTINEQDDTHASGLVIFAGEIAGGWWLAAKDGGNWIIVADGNGTISCADID